MQGQLNTHTTHYDLHRLVVLMILVGACVTSTGISISVWAEYQNIGMQVFFRRSDFLGDYIHSPLAYVFNMSLITAGSCILLAMYGLFLLKLGDFSHFLSITGSWVGLSIILIGVFPINYLYEHRLVSTSFLLATFVLHLFTMSTRFTHKEICSKPLFILAIFGFISAVGLIYQLNWSILDFDACTHQDGEICWVAMNMWLQTNITMLWCVLLALNIRKIAKEQFDEESARQRANW